MSKKTYLGILLMLGFTAIGYTYPVSDNTKTAIMYCDYTGTDMDIIYNVYLKINFATVFELPPGKEIKNVVLGDPMNWRAKVDDGGVFCFVKPMETGARTSLSIVTEDGLNMVFNLLETTGSDLDKNTIAKVKIIIHDENFFITRTRDLLENKNRESSQKAKSDQKEEDIIQFIRKKSKKYRVKNNHFFIENVCDDGVVTYIYVPKAQYRPAVYFQKRKGGELEPVRYIDKGEYYVIHKVLSEPGNRFLFKLGKTETIIRMLGD